MKILLHLIEALGPGIALAVAIKMGEWSFMFSHKILP
jgi:hypothetical protein